MTELMRVNNLRMLKGATTINHRHTIYESPEFIDGMSVHQTNGFDCGVYACINAESYLNGEDHNKFHANSIPLMRIKYIRDIYSFRRNSNFPPQYLNIE